MNKNKSVLRSSLFRISVRRCRALNQRLHACSRGLSTEAAADRLALCTHWTCKRNFLIMFIQNFCKIPHSLIFA